MLAEELGDNVAGKKEGLVIETQETTLAGSGWASQGTQIWLSIQEEMVLVLCILIYLDELLKLFFSVPLNSGELESLIIKDLSSFHFYKSNYYLINWG